MLLKALSLFAILSVAAMVPAQTHTALSVDLRDGQLTPIAATTIKQFEPIKLDGITLDPQIWGLGAYDLSSKRFSLGVAGVIGFPLAPGWEVFGGLSGQWSAENRISAGVIVGFDYRF